MRAVSFREMLDGYAAVWSLQGYVFRETCDFGWDLGLSI